MYILRGVPGSGKSTLALELAGEERTRIFSADDFFGEGEQYIRSWSVEKAYVAHRWNQNRVKEAMAKGVTPVIVDNTNLRARMARVYVELSYQYQYWAELREPQTPWWLEISGLLKDKVANRQKLAEWSQKLTNVHGVKPERVLEMLMDYQPYTIEEIHERIKQGPE